MNDTTPATVAQPIYTTTRVTEFNGVEIRTEKNSQGWSGYARGYSNRPYAVKVGGKLLRTGNNAIRTFATREAARLAGEAAAK